jgi:hypothetical protein
MDRVHRQFRQNVSNGDPWLHMVNFVAGRRRQAPPFNRNYGRTSERRDIKLNS